MDEKPGCCWAGCDEEGVWWANFGWGVRLALCNEHRNAISGRKDQVE